MNDDTLVLPYAPRLVPLASGVHGAGLLLGPVELDRIGPADPRIAVPAESLADHEEHVGMRPHGHPGLIDLVDATGLTGHGGAHVPAALKWRGVLRGRGPLTVVANGAESEPLSAKDGVLLRQRPHLVLDGLELVGEALGAHRAVLWLHGDDEGARRSVERALIERQGYAYPRPDAGRHPLSPWTSRSHQIPVAVVSGPSHYLSGESSAIVRALSGGPALPTVHRRATDQDAPRYLVHNVETLARLALLARGLAAPATRLLTLLGSSTTAGRSVVEVPLDATIGEVLHGVRDDVTPPQAVLLGGFGGTWARWEAIADLAVDEHALRRAGTSLGAGVLAPVGPEVCGVRQTAAVLRYLASMSARQCGPCLFGLPALADGWEDLAAASGRTGVLDQLLADAGSITGRGACHHPDGATRLAASAVEVFRADLESHVSGRACRHAGQVVLPGTSVRGGIR